MAAPASEAPRVRVAAILETQDGIVLVAHRKDGRGYYLLPGGGVEPGERLTDALVREVSEETGLECSPQALALVSDSIDPHGSRHVIQLVFTARITGGSIVQSSGDPRVAAVETIPVSQLASLDFRPPLAAEIADALQNDGAPAGYIPAPWVPEAASDS